MNGYEIAQIVAACIIVIPLIRGAITDIRIRKFPAAYWDPFAKIAGVFTIFMYLLITADPLKMVFYLGLSLAAMLIFFAIGIRHGSGGDWRALMYCAVIAPLIFFNLTFLILLCILSIVIAIYSLMLTGPEHSFERHIPWAVAICGAFCVTLILSVLTGSIA